MHTHGMGNKMQQVTSSQVARWAASSAWSTQRKQHFPILISIARLCITRLRLHSILFRSNKFNTANFFCPGLQLHYLCGRRLCRRFDTFRGGWWLFCRHTSGDSLQKAKSLAPRRKGSDATGTTHSIQWQHKCTNAILRCKQRKS